MGDVATRIARNDPDLAPSLDSYSRKTMLI
jgi:hypothetical protein